MVRVKTCSKCKQELTLDKFYKRSNGSADGRNGICKACTEDAWGRDTKEDGWLMTALGSTYACERCAFEATCKNNIWRKTFDPYCFVEGKYHSFYVAEYAREVAA